MTPFFTVLYACFIVVVLVTAASGIAAFAQQTNVTSIMGLNASNIDNVTYNQDRLINIAKLHAPANQNGTLPQENIGHLLNCVKDFLVPGSFSFTKGLCEDLITDDIIHHNFGNNQSMINLSHAYLKLKGIQ